MKMSDILNEDGRIVKGVNTTVDVGPDEIKKQAKKFGNTVDKDGKPPTLSKKVKGASTNVAFNLGLAEDRFTEMELAVMEGGHSIDDLDERKLKTKSYKKSLGGLKASGRRHKRKLRTKFNEGYKLQLERDADMYVLHITDTASGKRTEVRGKKGYESGNYDASDRLHQLLDKIGKTANVSELINGEVVTINPKHPDADQAKTATDVAYNEGVVQTVKDTATAIKLIKKYHQTGKDEDAFAAIKHGWNFIKNPKMRSMIVNLVKKVSTENGYPNWNDTVAYIKKNTGIDVSNVNENFADGKKKGKSRPGRVKRSGASCNGSVTDLRKRAKNSSGEKARMYHWCANMKSGRKKK